MNEGRARVFKLTNWSKNILFILFGLLIVVGLVFIVTQICKKQSTIINTPIPTNSTSDWKIYLSKAHSFTFNYPDNWIYGENGSLYSRDGLRIYLRPKELNVNNITYGEINILVFDTTKTLNEFIDYELCEGLERCSMSKNAEIIKLGGVDARLIKDQGGPLPSDSVLA
ncbi:MAG: PsbP-related protein, partial [Bacteroidota bacterium]